MKTVEILERPTEPFEVAIAPDEPEYTLNVRTIDCLRAVARKGQLDFISQERKRPVSSRASSMKLIAEHAGATAPLRDGLHSQRYAACPHCGLNE
jgi:hypothetical protein